MDLFVFSLIKGSSQANGLLFVLTGECRTVVYAVHLNSLVVFFEISYRKIYV